MKSEFEYVDVDDDEYYHYDDYDAYDDKEISFLSHRSFLALSDLAL